MGRTPNGKKIAAEKAGVAVTDRGFINVDIQMRTNVPHIFAIGDIVGQPMLAHKAVHEAHVAAEVIAGELQGNKELAAAAFNARVIPSVAYTDPEVAWVGLTEDQAKAQGIKVKKGLFPWTASGRAIANGRDEGVTKLLFDDSPEAHGHGKILGGGMVGTHAGDMIGEIALAIEMGADAVDIGKTAAFNARVIPSVAYTDPEVAWVGLTEDQAKAQGIKVKKGLFPWTASGRAIANGRDEGVTKLLFDDSPEAHGHGKILGGGMVGTHAGDMIGEIALAIEMGADAVDIGKTIHPHPTLGESIGMAAEVAHGSCLSRPFSPIRSSGFL